MQVTSHRIFDRQAPDRADVQRIVPRPQPVHHLGLTVVAILQDLARGAVDEQHLVDLRAAFVVGSDQVHPVGDPREPDGQVVAGHSSAAQSR